MRGGGRYETERESISDEGRMNELGGGGREKRERERERYGFSPTYMYPHLVMVTYAHILTVHNTSVHVRGWVGKCNQI